MATDKCSPTVLVADDDPSLLRLVLKVLGREGYAVDGVSTGREVIDRVLAGGDYLLLLDFSLLDMSGKQVVEDLAAKGHKAPFIVMTGHGDERLAVDMMKLGALDYVMKDVAFVDLLPSVVGQAIEQLAVQSRLKAAETGLRRSEEKLAKAFQASPDWMLLLTVDRGIILEANDSFIDSTGYRRGEAIGVSCMDLGLCASPSQWKEMFSTLASGGEFKNREMAACKKDGSGLTLLLSADVFEADGEKCAIFVAHDITQRKQDQERILAALKEKDVLLKEIHHRVKNNLQAVTSLLSLQSRAMGEGPMKMACEDIANRIKSMALVHEMLYSADDFSGIDFGAYVGRMLDSLYRSTNTSKKRVAPVLALDGVRLGIDHAVPCGLIVNELASNTLRYAFGESGEGSLSISMSVADDDDGPKALELEVADDGMGLPEGIDFSRTDSLGLKLVKLLSEKQLGGSVSYDGEGGAKYTINFPLQVPVG